MLLRNLKEFNYKNDPLILDKLNSKSINYTTAHNIITNDKIENLIFDDQTLNIISALIKKSDFSKKLPLHHTPYVYLELNYIKELINKLPKIYTKNKHINFRKIFSNYMNYNTTIQWKHYNNWFKQKCFPLLFLRVLIKIHSNYFKINENDLLKDLILNIKGITDSRRQNSFNPPKKLKDLLTKQIFYVTGISLGDGTNLYSEGGWSVTDGHSNKKYLTYSYKHLTFIKNLIKKYFDIKSEIIKMPRNMFILRLTNKFFSRYLNFFLDVPFGKKKILRIPSIINFASKKQKIELKKTFYRGFFDCEGSVIKNSINIQITTTSTKLMYDLHKFLRKIGLNPNIKNYLQQNKRYSPLTNVFIPSTDYLKFALNIGFSHPLKKQLLIKGLKKGPTHKDFKGLKSSYSLGDQIPIEKLDGLYIRNAEKIFKNYRLNKGLSQKDLGKKINIRRATISSWERGINNIPLKILLELAYLNKKSKENLIKDLKIVNFNNIYGSYFGGRLIKIPFKITKELVLFAKFVRPLKNKIYIKRRNNNFKKEIGIFFNTKIETNKCEDYISSLLLRDIFQELFIYDIPWKPLNEEQIKNINRRNTL